MATQANTQPSRTAAIELALTMHRHGRWPEAERLYEAVLAEDPGDFDALHLSGVLRHQQGK